MACMRVLLQIPCDQYTPTTTTHDGHRTLRDDCIQFRLSVAQDSVQNRCASLDDLDDDDDDDDMMYDDYDDQQPGVSFAKALSGLSLLPRSKRSICFQVLEGAVTGTCTDDKHFTTEHQNAYTSQTTTTITNTTTATTSTNTSTNTTAITSTSKNVIKSFAHFASSCLLGETDPRCLVQMLQLLRHILITLLPFFHYQSQTNTNTNTNSDTQTTNLDITDTTATTTTAAFGIFPSIEIFDAVAPYYPVRFTPPANDPHGITKEGIHNALMGVLRCHTTCRQNTNTNDTNNQTNNDDEFVSGSMTVFSMKLFLERLSPPSMDPFADDDADDAESKTVHDRIDALEDMIGLLSLSSNDQHHPPIPLSEISHAVMKELSDVLIRCHEDASASAAPSGEDNEAHKKLANRCRYFANTMAFKLETQHDTTNATKRSSTGEKSFWDTFVLDAAQRLQITISTSPQSLKGRTSTAYLASLAACAGQQTLCLCLNTCIPPLLDMLRGSSEDMGGTDECGSLWDWCILFRL